MLKPRNCPYCTKIIPMFQKNGLEKQSSNYRKERHCGGKGCVKKSAVQEKKLKGARKKKATELFNGVIPQGTRSIVNSMVYKFGCETLGAGCHNCFFRECVGGDWVRVESLDRLAFCEGVNFETFEQAGI